MSDTFGPIPDPDPQGVTNDELGQVGEKLEAAENLWDTILSQVTPQVPCPECSGGAHVASGIFGAHQCTTCGGSRYVDSVLEDDDPGFEVPDLRTMRRQLGEQRQAWIGRQNALRAGTALPPGASKEAVQGLLLTVTAAHDAATAKRKELRQLGKAAAAPRQLAPVESQRKGGDFSDADLDDIEAEDRGRR